MRKRRASSDEEALGAFIGIVIAVFALIWLIEHVILPGLLIVAGIVVSVGGLFALYTSCRVFWKAVSDNKHPYSIYNDPYPHSPGVRRGYFFGPGLNQIKKIWSASQDGMDEAIFKIGHTLEGELQEGGLAIFLCINIWIYLLWLVSALFLYIFGYMFTFLFCFALSVVLAAGWGLFFTGYITLRLADKTFLLMNAIENRCPECKRRPIPLFLCPKCGTPHTLHPGPYGVFHIKCSCGEVLPTTAFNGRNNLAAICPVCHHPVEGYARHFGIQVVGNTSAGKTTYLASFFHEYLCQLPSYIKYSCNPQEGFEDFRGAFESGDRIPGTTERNAGMYSITHEVSMYAPYQLSMYDIAGEAFQNDGATGYQQQQFQYSEGVVLMIDPNDSSDASHTAIMSFCSEHRKMKNLMTSRMIEIPAAVVITKSDKYGAELSGDPQDEEVCTRFLAAHGFGNVIKLISANFTNAKYFVATATGHELDGSAYTPSGVLEPVMWILNERKSVLIRIITIGITIFDEVKFLLRKIVPFLVPVFILWLVFWGVPSVLFGKILQTEHRPSDSVRIALKASEVIPLQTQGKLVSTTSPVQNSTTISTARQKPGLSGKVLSQPEQRSREVEKDVPAPVLKLSTLGTKINVRKRPDINSESLEVLDEGVPVVAKEHTRKSDGTWYKVTIPSGIEGWIRGELLKPRISDKGEHGGVLMRVTGDELNLRDGPGKRRTSIGKLYIGHLVEVVGRSGAWRKVYTQTGELGWVHGGYLGERKRYSTF